MFTSCKDIYVRMCEGMHGRRVRAMGVAGEAVLEQQHKVRAAGPGHAERAHAERAHAEQPHAAAYRHMLPRTATYRRVLHIV